MNSPVKEIHDKKDIFKAKHQWSLVMAEFMKVMKRYTPKAAPLPWQDVLVVPIDGYDGMFETVYTEDRCIFCGKWEDFMYHRDFENPFWDGIAQGGLHSAEDNYDAGALVCCDCFHICYKERDNIRIVNHT